MVKKLEGRTSSGLRLPGLPLSWSTKRVQSNIQGDQGEVQLYEEKVPRVC